MDHTWLFFMPNTFHCYFIAAINREVTHRCLVRVFCYKKWLLPITKEMTKLWYLGIESHLKTKHDPKPTICKYPVLSEQSLVIFQGIPSEPNHGPYDRSMNSPLAKSSALERHSSLTPFEEWKEPALIHLMNPKVTLVM